MSLRAILAAVAACWLALAPQAAVAQAVNSGNVEGELHSARAAVAPGETFTIVLRQRINDGWHTYWRNPGDSGEPTELTWSVPAGWSVGDIQWPAPEAIPFATLVNHGYSGEVLFPIEVTAPANARVGESVTLTADAYWLVCSDICIPEEAQLLLNVPVAAQGSDDATWAPRVAEAVAALPRRDDSVQARISAGNPAILTLNAPGANVEDAHFFPFSRDAIDHAAPQAPSVGPGGVSFSLTSGAGGELGGAPLDGVVTLRTADGAHLAYEIAAQPGDPLPDAGGTPIGASRAVVADAPPMAWPALLAAIGFAFLGGLILNIMPCVLPVLSIKALSFAGGAQAGQARRHGLLYGAGVLFTFLALAGLLIVLRGAGDAIGWGFQFQSPLVTSGLALLFFVIGLNLLGLFDIGGSLQNVGGGAVAHGGDAGAFFTGALAVVAATPCTAPFMAGAIGAALTQSAGIILLIFGALALGFAAPLVALAFAPGLQKRIPKPGPWMERAKNVLAFPMFAAAIWLAWVLAEQTGAGGAAALLSIALALGFAIFVARWGRVWLAVGVIAFAMTGVMAWAPLTGTQREAVLAHENWTPARVAELRAEGRPVFVNFTAAWCVTCKVNEVTALSSARVARAFEQSGAAYLKGDWTNRDETIAAALAEHGRAGVPLYLYYAPGADAVVLPQVLSESLMLETLEGDAP